MSERRTSTISRRSALTGAVRLAAFAGTAAVAFAGAKAPQTAVQYQTAPNAGKKCADCAQFRAPGACQLVEGPISPAGWCRLFAAKTA